MSIEQNSIRQEQEADLEKARREFAEKNEIFAMGSLRGPFDWLSLDLGAFIDEMFIRNDSDVPFQDVLCPDYLLWKAHMEQQKIRKAKGEPVTDFDFKSKFTQRLYNGIAVYWTGKYTDRKKSDGTVEKVKRFSRIPILRNDPERWNRIRGKDDCYMAPVTYAGKNRSNKNARYIYAIGIDLDEVGPAQLEGLFTNCTREYVGQHGPVGRPLIPVPNIITNSGHGLHVYYLLSKPVALTSEPVKKIMNLVKENLTGLIYKRNTTRKKGWEKLSLLQSFRLPETKTKFGETVTSWLNQDRSQPYSIEELNEFFYEDKLTKDQIRTVLSPFEYSSSMVTAAEAQRRWPEWYQARIVEGKWISEAKKWHVNRAVYDWWKDKLWQTKSEIVGHRFWCMLCLYVYAIKCDIPLDEVNRDAEELMAHFESFTLNSIDNHFTLSDIYAAAAAYHVNYSKFPIWKIESLTTIHIEKSRRNGRNKEAHLRRARAVQNIDDPNGNWRYKDGRTRMYEKVAQWRKDNPENYNKSQCARDCGLSRPTVVKWWDAADIVFENGPSEIIAMWREDNPGSTDRNQCAKDTRLALPTVLKYWKADDNDVEKVNEILSGSGISTEELSEFLKNPENLEAYKQMIHHFISTSKNKK